MELKALKVDGGMVQNELLMQFQSDILGVPAVRPKVAEATALGAAYAAGLAVGTASLPSVTTAGHAPERPSPLPWKQQTCQALGACYCSFQGFAKLRKARLILRMGEGQALLWLEPLDGITNSFRHAWDISRPVRISEAVQIDPFVSRFDLNNHDRTPEITVIRTHQYRGKCRAVQGRIDPLPGKHPFDRIIKPIKECRDKMKKILITKAGGQKFIQRKVVD